VHLFPRFLLHNKIGEQNIKYNKLYRGIDGIDEINVADLFVVLSCSSFVYLIICGELFVYGEVQYLFMWEL